MNGKTYSLINNYDLKNLVEVEPSCIAKTSRA